MNVASLRGSFEPGQQAQPSGTVGPVLSDQQLQCPLWLSQKAPDHFLFSLKIPGVPNNYDLKFMASSQSGSEEGRAPLLDPFTSVPPPASRMFVQQDLILTLSKRQIKCNSFTKHH